MDYTTLITSEHQGQPKFMAWLNVALGMVLDIQNFLKAFSMAYDVDHAVGAQLEVLGQFLNLSRKLQFQPSDGVSPVMDDGTYRIALKAKIAQAHYDGTIPGLFDLFQNVLGSTGLYFSITDNQDMSMIAIAFGSLPSLVSDLFNNGYLIPRPAGVSMEIQQTNNKVFSWGEDNDYFSGWGTGYWLMKGFSSVGGSTSSQFLLLDAGGSKDELRTVFSAGDSSSAERVLLEGSGSSAI